MCAHVSSSRWNWTAPVVDRTPRDLTTRDQRKSQIHKDGPAANDPPWPSIMLGTGALIGRAGPLCLYAVLLLAESRISLIIRHDKIFGTSGHMWQPSCGIPRKNDQNFNK